eukprot:Gb_40468 [translate_table: standard]
MPSCTNYAIGHGLLVLIIWLCLLCPTEERPLLSEGGTGMETRGNTMILDEDSEFPAEEEMIMFRKGRILVGAMDYDDPGANGKHDPKGKGNSKWGGGGGRKSQGGDNP